MLTDLPDSILFRPVLLRDLDAIAEIEAACFDAGVREDRALYEKRIEVFRDGFLVAEDHETGQVGAYICSEIWHKDMALDSATLALGHDPLNAHNPQGTQLYITSFGTRPDWRGRQIGTGLLQALEKRIRAKYPAVDESILIVSEKWNAAHHIYEKDGFKEIGRIINFFTPENKPEEDAILMRKTL